MPFPDSDEDFFALAKNHPRTPSIMVEIHDSIKSGCFEERLLQHAPGTFARMEITLELLDVRAKAFLKLVDTIDHQILFRRILEEIERTAWMELAGFSLNKANWQSPDTRRLWKMITDRTAHWEAEGFRSLIRKEGSESGKAEQARRGYRIEVRAWMKRESLDSVAQAAKYLGVSESTLKSIMSDKGMVRYGPETLETVLKKIGYKNG